MQVLYFSDIHAEVRRRDPPPPWIGSYPLHLGPSLEAYANHIDLAIVAGDVGRLAAGRSPSSIDYCEQAGQFLGCPVVFVPGNHDYYRGNFDSDRERLLNLKMEWTTALDRGEAFFGSGDKMLRVLGATLWTDYSAFGDAQTAMIEAQRLVPDHTLITLDEGKRSFTPAEALLQYSLSRRWLSEKLDETHTGPTLVVTHFVPHPIAHHPNFARTALSAAFCCDCGDLIEKAKAAGAVGWIYGHNHWSQNHTVAELPLLSAQIGYPAEDTNWTGPGLLEIR